MRGETGEQYTCRRETFDLVMELISRFLSIYFQHFRKHSSSLLQGKEILFQRTLEPNPRKTR